MMVKESLKFIIPSLVLASISLNTWAKPTTETSESVSQEAEQYEKIEITGGKWLTTMKLEYRRAKWDFYDMYNALVTNDKFNVNCRRVAMPGSHVKRGQCTRQYFSDKYSELQERNNYLWRYGGHHFKQVTHATVKREVKDFDEQAELDLIEKLKANPELLAQFREMVQKENEFIQRHIEIWGEDSMYFETDLVASVN